MDDADEAHESDEVRFDQSGRCAICARCCATGGDVVGANPFYDTPKTALRTLEQDRTPLEE